MKAIGLDNAEVCMLFSCYDKSSLAMFYYEHSYSIKSLSVCLRLTIIYIITDGTR